MSNGIIYPVLIELVKVLVNSHNNTRYASIIDSV
jgi:hypothetical protein